MVNTNQILDFKLQTQVGYYFFFYFLLHYSTVFLAHLPLHQDQQLHFQHLFYLCKNLIRHRIFLAFFRLFYRNLSVFHVNNYYNNYHISEQVFKYNQKQHYYSQMLMIPILLFYFLLYFHYLLNVFLYQLLLYLNYFVRQLVLEVLPSFHPLPCQLFHDFAFQFRIHVNRIQQVNHIILILF